MKLKKEKEISVKPAESLEEACAAHSGTHGPHQGDVELYIVSKYIPAPDSEKH